MFFNIGAGEMMLIAIVLLIAVGPEQLPGVIRKVGRTMGQLKSMSDRLRDDFMAGMNQIEEVTDVKSWADKLETPWAEPLDNSSWARNIDPPFTGRPADGDDTDDTDDTDEREQTETVQPEEVDPAPIESGEAAPSSAGDGPDASAEATAPARSDARPEPGDEGDEGTASTNGHAEVNRSDNGTDDAHDTLAEGRE